MRTIFALASGRSGTHFLYKVIQRNAQNCVVRHEPYGYNPSMFGRPIYDHHVGEKELIRRLLGRKRRIIERFAPRVYIETSHAFLKSYYNLAIDYFPNMQLVHLVRNPLHVAKSMANREDLAKRFHVPFCHYRGQDGRKYFRWSLTRLEPIYTHFDVAKLSTFQCCLLEWIEIENRASWFLDEFGKRNDCVTIRVPEEINDTAAIERAFDQLGLERTTSSLDLGGRKNRTPGIPTEVTSDDQRQFAKVMERLPATYLIPFQREPYLSCEWAKVLRG